MRHPKIHRIINRIKRGLSQIQLVKQHKLWDLANIPPSHCIRDPECWRFRYNYNGDIDGSIISIDYWPTWKHDNHRTGLASKSDKIYVTISYGNNYLYAINPDGSIEWIFEAEDPISTPPVVDNDGTIYFGAGHRLYAVYHNGLLKWKSFDSLDYIVAHPIVAPNGNIFFGNQSGYIYLVRPDGSVVSQGRLGEEDADADSLFVPAAIDYDGNIYVSGSSGYLYSMTPSFSINWKLDISPRIVSIDSNGIIYASTQDGYIYAIKADGTIKWQVKIVDAPIGTPVISSNGKIYVGAFYDGNIHVINSSDGSIENFFPVGMLVDSPVIAPDGTIYVAGGNSQDTIIALNPDGTLKWTFEAPNEISTVPATDKDGVVYFGCQGETIYEGYIYALNPDGTVKWSISIEGHPFISLALTKEIPIVPYPMPRYNIKRNGRAKGHSYIYVSTLGSILVITPRGTLKRKILKVCDAPPIISSDGTIYAIFRDQYFSEYDSYMSGLRAINPDGSLKWINFTYGGYLEQPVKAPNGKIYVSTRSFVFSITPDTGEMEEIYEGDVRNLTITPDGTIYSAGGAFRAFDLNFNLEWSFDLECFDSGIAIGTDGTIYVGGKDGYLYALNPDGTLKWRYPIDTSRGEYLLYSPSVGDDGTVYLATQYALTYSVEEPSVYAFTPDGELKWQFYGGEWGYAKPLAIGPDGTVYASLKNGKLCAISSEDGSVKWYKHFLTDGSHYDFTSPSVAYDGTIYATCEDAYLYAFNPDGSVKWKYNIEVAYGLEPVIV